MTPVEQARLETLEVRTVVQHVYFCPHCEGGYRRRKSCWHLGECTCLEGYNLYHCASCTETPGELIVTDCDCLECATQREVTTNG